MAHAKETLLEIRHLTKIFPGVVAVNDVSFSIQKGEVHIIIGENGAGKSTLVKMIAGLYGVDGGEMILEGERYAPSGVLDAQQYGINIIHQELSLLMNRTVAQNVYVGREPVKNRLRFVDFRKMDSDCKNLLESLDIQIDPEEIVSNLSIAQQQMIEVAKAISTNNKLLIMDEPTSSLTKKEIDNLFALTRKLRDSGMTIIYISHRMQELAEIGDRIIVMRDGRYVATRNAGEIDMKELISLMVGRTIDNIYNRTYNESDREMLRVKNLTGIRFRNVNLSVREGEIVGIAGLVGAGRSELTKSIFGCDPIDSGEVFLAGKKISGKGYGTYTAVKNRISFLPENRKTEGLCIRMSIRDNIVQPSLRKLFPKGLVNDQKIKEVAANSVRELRIATTGSDKLVNELSGGNQQKVVLAKWLVSESRLFLFDEPTRGVDVGAKNEIYGIMNKLAAGGNAVLMISSDLPELLGLADRIYVLKDGELCGEVRQGSAEFTQEHILSLAIGGRKEQ
jgi:ABC-type sugar transport system ATPase subunit